jgi:tRNA(Leu) C34 or U34 (ribose-2'-O)-methylase TrmL
MCKVSLGIMNPKSPQNMGSIMRAAGCYGVDAVYYTGQRYARAKTFATDTQDVALKLPCIGVDKLHLIVPRGATVVAVELVEGAQPLPYFQHPANAFYIFGPEDGSISQHTLSWCDHVVYIPTKGCMNLAATVNVLLYDRLAKSENFEQGDELIRRSRDTNNRVKVLK